MRENIIEKSFVKAVENRGGMALKFNSINFNGVPDRLVLLPNGRIAFVELKATDKKMRPLQKKRKRQLESLGFLVFCIDSKEKIEEIIDEI